MSHDCKITGKETLKYTEKNMLCHNEDYRQSLAIFNITNKRCLVTGFEINFDSKTKSGNCVNIVIQQMHNTKL